MRKVGAATQAVRPTAAQRTGEVLLKEDLGVGRHEHAPEHGKHRKRACSCHWFLSTRNQGEAAEDSIMERTSDVDLPTNFQSLFGGGGLLTSLFVSQSVRCARFPPPLAVALIIGAVE